LAIAASSGGTILAAGRPIMSWFDVADGRLRYRGRISKEPVAEWLASDDGLAAVQAATRQVRFALFGRARSARRRVARELQDAIGSPSLREGLPGECDRLLAAWTGLAYAPSLPRLTVALQRLVVVPRAMIPSRALPGLGGRLAERLGAGVPDSFPAFFSRWILGSMDEAIRRARPSPERPVYACESWASVGLDTDFVWIDPLWSGPEWRGHVVMYEMPAPSLRRRERREVENAVTQLTQSLPNLTRLQRDALVRLAADQMTALTV
jgi:hypothetical protein